MEISYGIMCRRKRQKKPPLTSHHSSGVHPEMLILLTERIVRSIVGANGASVLMSGWLRKAPDCQCDFSEDSASSWSSRLPSV
jgi:hypothetical protein